ncbi:MAG: anthranilate synthase component I [Chloroflexi bacterium]|nr:anthranilate synthase component I [Chloroflexota bacterium]
MRELAKQGNLIPIYREILADLETPVSAFAKVARGPYGFLLESVEGGERMGRYSFIGTEPYLVLRAGESVDPLQLLGEELRRHRPVTVPGLPRFHGGAVGYLSYELVRHIERLPAPSADPLGLPLATFLFTDTLLVFDHLKHKIKVLSHVKVNGDLERSYADAVERIDRLVARLQDPQSIQQRLVALSPGNGGRRWAGEPASWANLSKEAFEENVRRAKEYILAGDIFQVVLSRRVSRQTSANPFTIYRALRTVNPSPYMCYLQLGDAYLISASPELLVQVEDGTVSVHPIAGTRRRGRDEAEDAELEADLRADRKERAEHVMLLDLGRNDVGRVSVPGSVQVRQMMDVERYSHVMHLVSHVTGRLSPDYTPLDALRAGFPAGTVSGAPKVRAMEIIAELEPDRRGPYAGGFGVFDYSGNVETAITIRTIVLKDGVATIQSGGGIVADSDPESEYQEAVNKARALLVAIDEAEAMEDATATGGKEPDATAHRQLRQLYV